MEAIKNLGVFNYLRNGEHIQLHWTLIHFLTDKVTEFPVLSPEYTAYKQLFDHEDIVFKHNATMVGTAAVKAADRVRGDAFRALRMTVKALTRNINPANRQLANDLMIIINNYKEAPHKPYTENTSYITNMVKELRLPENFDKVDELMLNELLTELDNANIAFVTVYNNRSKWIKAKRLQGNMMDIRRPLDLAFRELATSINSLYKVNELGEKDVDIRQKLEEIIVGVNADIENALRTIAYRSPGHKPNPGPRPGPGPGPVEPFSFEAVSQTKQSDTTMRVEAPDAEAFAAALFEQAMGATMNTRENPEASPNIFTVTGFTKNAEDVADGLIFTCMDTKTFMADLVGSPVPPRELVLDGEVIAMIGGLLDPDMLLV